jgi:hypothetical protein
MVSEMELRSASATATGRSVVGSLIPALAFFPAKRRIPVSAITAIADGIRNDRLRMFVFIQIKRLNLLKSTVEHINHGDCKFSDHAPTS